MSTSKNENNINTYPIIGFLPEYLPDGYLNGNTSSFNNVTPTTLHPLIEIKIDPPSTADDELSRRQFLSVDSKNSVTSNEFKNSNNKITATAPSMEEINFQTEMTMSEKNDILKEFATLINNKYEIEGELEFKMAEKKILQLLSNKKLTTNEKTYFTRILNNILTERQNWLKKMSEEDEHSCYSNTFFQINSAVFQVLLLYYCILYNNEVVNGLVLGFVVLTLIGTLVLIILQSFFIKTVYFILDIILSSMLCWAYIFILLPQMEIIIIIIVMYVLAGIYLVNIITKTYWLATKNNYGYNFTMTPIEERIENDNVVNYHSRPYKSSTSHSPSFRGTNNVFNYHLPSFVNVDQISYIMNEVRDSDDCQVDNNCTYEYNVVENIGNENDNSNTCNTTDYVDYNNDNGGGDFGCQESYDCDE